MLLAPFYREFELPWEGDPESESRFRKILRVLLILLILFGILFPCCRIRSRPPRKPKCRSASRRS